MPQDEGSEGLRLSTDSEYVEDYGPEYGTAVDVRPCRCQSPCCPRCSGGFAFKRARQWVRDCQRLGVDNVALLTVTRDASRFPDPEHVISARVAFHLMNHVWDVLGANYRAQWGERPLWWSFREVHDGARGGAADSAARGAIHLHIYFPCPTASGKIGRRKLLSIKDKGVELSGRTTWGWARQGVYVLPVASASPYAAKGISYAVKGAVDDRMLDSVRVELSSRSRAVSDDDPANVQRREQDRVRLERRRAAREVYRRLRHELGPKSRAVAAARDVWRQLCRPSVPRGPMRTHRERLLRCAEKTVLTDGRRYVGTLDVPYDHACRVLSEAVPSECFPVDWFLPEAGGELRCNGRGVRLPVKFVRRSLSEWVGMLHGPCPAWVQGWLPLVHSSSPPLVKAPVCPVGARSQPGIPGERSEVAKCLSGSGVRSSSAAFCDLTAGSGHQTSLRGAGSGLCVPPVSCLRRPGTMLSLSSLCQPPGSTRVVCWGGAVLTNGGGPNRTAASTPKGPHILVKSGCSVRRGSRSRNGP